MAQRRMLSKSISLSAQVDQLDDRAALLFTWMIPHGDDEGCIRGATKLIKATVIPLRSGRFWSERCIENYLLCMVDAGLIHYWWQAGARYLQFTGWKRHQTIQTDRASISSLPVYNPEKAKDASEFPDLPNSGDMDTKRIQNLVGLDTQYLLNKININKFKEKEILFSRLLKGLERKAAEKARDPRINRLIGYFLHRVKEKKGFKPEIRGGKDAYMVKLRLSNYSEVQLRELIDAFLESPLSEKLSCSLSVCLSTTVLNQWLSGKLLLKSGITRIGK